jgi:hypothetical protein
MKADCSKYESSRRFEKWDAVGRNSREYRLQLVELEQLVEGVRCRPVPCNGGARI